MKYYYYSDNDKQLGPFTIDELKSKRIKKSTLVWTDGMSEWMIAENVDELSGILFPEPPPLPNINIANSKVEIIQIKETSISIDNSKYDPDYVKEGEAIFLGIFLLLVPILLKFSGIINFETEESYIRARNFAVIIDIIIRILVSVKVVKIATRQNRNHTGWGWFAFFFPSIALIIIGQLKKLRLKIDLDRSLSSKEQVALLLEKAKQLYSQNNHKECIVVLNKAIEIEKTCFECIKFRALSHYKVKNFKKSKLDFELLLKEEKYPSTTYYGMGNIAIEEKNEELAISYWLKAYEYKNEKAKIQLDVYHTYKGVYLLDKSITKSKVIRDSNAENFSFWDLKYQKGLLEIDQIDKLDTYTTYINGYDMGIDIELRRVFKTFHLGISYSEIEDITLIESEKTFELHLIDKNILIFSYDLAKDSSFGLENLCIMYKSVMDKTPSAWSYFNKLN